jgi:hypothetical protein
MPKIYREVTWEIAGSPSAPRRGPGRRVRALGISAKPANKGKGSQHRGRIKAKDPVNKHRLLVSYWRHPLKLIYGSCTRILLFFMMVMVESLDITHYDMPRPDIAAKILRQMSSMVGDDADELH